MYVDHVRLQSVRNLIQIGFLSGAARRLLERIAEGSLPPVLVASPYPIDHDLFGEDLVAADEFLGPYQELDSLDLVGVDEVIGEDEERGGVWVTLRLAWDMPLRGDGLLA